jgi:hypothetical protein
MTGSLEFGMLPEGFQDFFSFFVFEGFSQDHGIEALSSVVAFLPVHDPVHFMGRDFIDFLKGKQHLVGDVPCTSFVVFLVTIQDNLEKVYKVTGKRIKM